MTTAEKNRLIAEFMGARILKKGQQAYDMDTKFPDGSDRRMPEDMKYDRDWNWLMSVVEEINNTGKSGGIKYGLFDALGNADIERAFNEVVGFIEWFNLKK